MMVFQFELVMSYKNREQVRQAQGANNGINARQANLASSLLRTKSAQIISMHAYEQVASKRVKSSYRVTDNHE